MIESEGFTFENWGLIEFVKGRKELLITIVGGVAGYLATHNPLYAGIIAACTELIVSLLEFYCREGLD